MPGESPGALLSAVDRQRLIEHARAAVTTRIGGGREARGVAEEPDAPALASPGAAFVTLHVDGALRGCIGTSERRRSLWRVVGEMASAAATRDPRFPPIAAGDLPGMTVEISVLSPDVVIHRPEEIEIGRHGLDIRRDGARGLLLPQVAVEHGFDREKFLAATCRKAGLPADAWHDDATEIRVFEAEVFGDEPDTSPGDA
ncbi:MAG TPA: AmmeMemoRadiSam system protein A [Polyangia bacterium]|nr:AmmeMemoRadiSam system protein A [Polyangia bacterium]